MTDSSEKAALEFMREDEIVEKARVTFEVARATDNAFTNAAS